MGEEGEVGRQRRERDGEKKRGSRTMGRVFDNM